MDRKKEDAKKIKNMIDYGLNLDAVCRLMDMPRDEYARIRAEARLDDMGRPTDSRQLLFFDRVYNAGYIEGFAAGYAEWYEDAKKETFNPESEGEC